MPPGRGPGRGRGRGPPAARIARNQHARHAAAAAPAPAPPPDQTPPEAETPPPTEVAPPPKQEVSYDCEFPRCDKPSEYGFKDEGSFPQFCVEHKSAEMVILVSDPDNPQDSTLEGVRQYTQMKPRLEELKDAPAEAAACKAEIKKLSSEIYKEDHDLKELTKAVDGLDLGLADQAKKPRGRGKTLLGKGRFMQDQNLIDKMTKEKEIKEGKAVELKGDREINESHLEQLKEDLKPLAIAAAEYATIEKSMQELKAYAIEQEASGLYLQLKAKGMEAEMNAEGEVIFARLLEQDRLLQEA